MNPIILHWQAALSHLLQWYTAKRPRTKYFFPILFFSFVGINVFCYWWAIFTVYPRAIFGDETWFYIKVQVPVGILGALFDSLSFFITIYIIRRAVRSSSMSNFMSHLSLDLVIAVLATFWVVFVFSVSGWIVSLTEPVEEVLSERNALYRNRVINAVRQPTRHWRNIYFGLIMGASAMIPTCIHIVMALKSIYQVKVLNRDYPVKI